EQTTPAQLIERRERRIFVNRPGESNRDYRAMRNPRGTDEEVPHRCGNRGCDADEHEAETSSMMSQGIDAAERKKRYDDRDANLAAYPQTPGTFLFHQLESRLFQLLNLDYRVSMNRSFLFLL